MKKILAAVALLFSTALMGMATLGLPGLALIVYFVAQPSAEQLRVVIFAFLLGGAWYWWLYGFDTGFLIIAL